MNTMKLKFNLSPAMYPGGARYVTGRWYYLDRHECCMWVRRSVVDLASMEPAHLTPEAIAEHEGNLRPGRQLTLKEVLAELHRIG
jgi:hypothetical protein